MTAQLDHDRLDAMNDRANWLFGNVLLGKASVADIAEFERSAKAFQSEVIHGEEMARYDESELPISIDHEALEAYYESLSDVPY